MCVCVGGEGLISGDIKKGSDMSVRAYLQGDLITRNVTVNAPNFDSRFTLVTKLKAGDPFIGYSFALKFYLDFVSDSASGASSLM